jgi:hypothetical protein
MVMTEGTSRRILLKAVAALPLAATFGLLASPLLRFLRPTLKPLHLGHAYPLTSNKATRNTIRKERKRGKSLVS